MNLPGRDTNRYLQEMDHEVQIVLDSLRDSFEASPSPLGPLPGKRRLSDDERESWQLLQETLPSDTIGYADVTCLLAYYGVEYSRNVRRLMRPYTLKYRAASGSQTSRGREVGRGDSSNLPGHLARIYDRWRDPVVLDWLLGPHLPGRSGRVAGHLAIACLWDDHRSALLRASAASLACRTRVADALVYTCRMLEEPQVWRAYARHLRQALYSRDLLLRRTALRLLAHLRLHTDIRADETLICLRQPSNNPLVARTTVNR